MASPSPRFLTLIEDSVRKGTAKVPAMAGLSLPGGGRSVYFQSSAPAVVIWLAMRRSGGGEVERSGAGVEDAVVSDGIQSWVGGVQIAVISDGQQWCGYCVSSPGHESLSNEVGGAGRAAPRYPVLGRRFDPSIFAHRAYIHILPERRRFTVFGLKLPYRNTVQSDCRIGKHRICIQQVPNLASYEQNLKQVKRAALSPLYNRTTSSLQAASA